MKSPIQLKENRSHASYVPKSLIPAGKVVHSFLFFDGEVEFELAKSGRFVVAHTNKYAVYEFWRCAMVDPSRLAEVAEHLAPNLHSRLFHIFQENWVKYKDPFVRSAMFFLLSHYSNTGRPSTGKFEERPLTPLAFSNLRNLEITNLHVQHDAVDNIIESLKEISDEDYILLRVGKYYPNFLESGQSVGFEDTRVYHHRIKKWFNKTSLKSILIYEAHPRLFKFYHSHSLIMLDKYGNKIKSIGITNQRESTVLWDKSSGEPVYPIIVWQDRRTIDKSRQLSEEGHERTIQE